VIKVLNERSGHVLNRNEQLPRLSETNRSTRSVFPCPTLEEMVAQFLTAESGLRRCASTKTSFMSLRLSSTIIYRKMTIQDGTMFDLAIVPSRTHASHRSSSRARILTKSLLGPWRNTLTLSATTRRPFGMWMASPTLPLRMLGV